MLALCCADSSLASWSFNFSKILSTEVIQFGNMRACVQTYQGLAPRMGLAWTYHWGRGGLETNKNILSTLQALVEGTHHLPAHNRLGTFQMFLQVPGQTHDVGTFMEHFECNINMCNTFDPP